MTQSMSKIGYPYDTATMERYFNSLKNEQIRLHHDRTEKELYEAVEEFVYVKYNHSRPYSYNGYKILWRARYGGEYLCSKKLGQSVTKMLDHNERH